MSDPDLSSQKKHRRLAETLLIEKIAAMLCVKDFVDDRFLVMVVTVPGQALCSGAVALSSV